MNFESTEHSCIIPMIMRNQWFSWERGKETFTEFRTDFMSNRGHCIDMKREYLVNYTFVFHNRENNCFYCVKILVRTVNVLEKIESKFDSNPNRLNVWKNDFDFDNFSGGCVTLSGNEKPSVEFICRSLKEDQQLVTLFSENFIPVNCRSSLEGVWQFAYRVYFINDKSFSHAPYKNPIWWVFKRFTMQNFMVEMILIAPQNKNSSVIASKSKILL